MTHRSSYTRILDWSWYTTQPHQELFNTETLLSWTLHVHPRTVLLTNWLLQKPKFNMHSSSYELVLTWMNNWRMIIFCFVSCLKVVQLHQLCLEAECYSLGSPWSETLGHLRQVHGWSSSSLPPHRGGLPTSRSQPVNHDEGFSQQSRKCIFHNLWCWSGKRRKRWMEFFIKSI